uniref:Secreted protein n=1 Tax=Daphnia galeata TaxID=27404 RepID=A0A8J2RU60_9CRUS|nr:unnamed protein product [Daphnia galeata]
MVKYLLLTVLLVGLVAASLGSPVASGTDDVQDQLPETDMDGSEFFHSPYHRPIGAGFYDYGYPLNRPFGAGYGGLPAVHHPGVLPGVIPQHPFFYHK